MARRLSTAALFALAALAAPAVLGVVVLLAFGGVRLF